MNRMEIAEVRYCSVKSAEGIELIFFKDNVKLILILLVMYYNLRIHF